MAWDAGKRAAVDAVLSDVVRWRHHLHQHPEISFHEHETARFVRETLLTFPGIEVSSPTPTSVMGRLRGRPGGPVVAVRADMDALPIQEENDFDFASQNAGAMHACGHDGHTAMLLGAAKVLSGMRDELAGEVRLLFQHAEELLPGGAQEMVAAGVMDGVDLVIGAHLWMPLAVGQVGVAEGPLTAAPDTFRIIVRGKGGHAAQPHMTVDPIAIGAEVVTNLQQVVARQVDPLDRLVVSVTRFAAGTADNIIPESAELWGTVRSFNPDLAARVPELMERIVRGITEAHGATYAFHYEHGYRSVVNDEKVTAWVREALTEALGADHVVLGEPSMGGEDFSAFQQKAPGTFFMVGAGNPEKGITHPHHHPRFTVDEDAFAVGVAAFVSAIPSLLERAAADRSSAGKV